MDIISKINLSVQVINMGAREFSRGRALNEGVHAISNINSLLFFTDVDMLFNYETIQRIRLNTIMGVQVSIFNINYINLFLAIGL